MRREARADPRASDAWVTRAIGARPRNMPQEAPQSFGAVPGYMRAWRGHGADRHD